MTFSIIIPVYNTAPYLRECLDSVLAAARLLSEKCEARSEKCGGVEFICCDDGSADGSAAILDEYAAKDQRIQVIHLSHIGVGAARNAALDVAKGEWILFLDSDDCIAPEALNRLQNVITENPQELLIRFGYVQGSEASFWLSPHLPAVRHDVSRELKFDDYYAYGCQFAYKRSAIADVRFEKYFRGEDRLFLASVLCKCVSSYLSINDALYFYRTHSASATNRQAGVQAMKDELSHRADIIELFDNCGKRVSYRDVYWLGGYCLGEYLRLVKQAGCYSVFEKKELVEWFYHELPRFRRAKGYSIRNKVRATLHWLFGLFRIYLSN